MSLFLKNPRNYPYPENLYACVFEQNPDDIALPADWEASLEYVYSTLKERSVNLLILYFRDKCSLSVIAKKYGCSRQWVQQIIVKAIWKLRHASRAKYLQQGLAARKEMSIEPSTQGQKEEVDIVTADDPYWDLFNGWSSSSLYYAGIRTVEDLTHCTESQLLNIRGIGKGKVTLIKESLASAGFSLRTEGKGEAFVLNPRALNRSPERYPGTGYLKHRRNDTKAAEATPRTYIDWRDVDPGFSVVNPNASCFHHYTDDDFSLLISERILPNTNLGDPFCRKAAETLLKACIYYLCATAYHSEQNLFNVCNLLRCGALPEEDGHTETSLDLLFTALAAKKPEHRAVRYYKIYKTAAGKTSGTVNEFCRMRLRQYLTSLHAGF